MTEWPKSIWVFHKDTDPPGSFRYDLVNRDSKGKERAWYMSKELDTVRLVPLAEAVLSQAEGLGAGGGD